MRRSKIGLADDADEIENLSDLELEDFGELVEKIEMESTLDDYERKQRKQDDSHKTNFLIKYFEQTETMLKEQQSKIKS